MRIWKPGNRLAGFLCAPDAGDGLPFLELGEVWVPLDWQIGWHRNAGDELYYQVRGSSHWQVGTDQFEVPEGHCYWIRAGARHCLRRFEGNSVHFYFLVVPLADLPALADVPALAEAVWRVFAGTLEIQEQLKGLVHEVVADRPWRREVCLGRLHLLGYALARQLVESQAPAPAGDTVHPGAARAMELLGANPGHSWNLPELARRAGVSIPHLCALFKRAYAQPPMRALQRIRVEEAVRRLRETDQTITRIAHDLGFASSQHFSREFRRHTGLTPRATRVRSTGKSCC